MAEDYPRQSKNRRGSQLSQPSLSMGLSEHKRFFNVVLAGSNESAHEGLSNIGSIRLSELKNVVNFESLKKLKFN